MKVWVKKATGRPWSDITKPKAIDRRVLMKMGECLVKVLGDEARKDFAKRGWSGRDPGGGPPIWDSFSYEIVGKGAIAVSSTFWGIEEMVSEGGVPGRTMTWLTQASKDKHPTRYKLTRTEHRLKMKKGAHLKKPGEKVGFFKRVIRKVLGKGHRLPLVVPIRTKAGTVVFRTAPFQLNRAWVHPGIAKFTFMERAMTKGQQLCSEILGEHLIKTMIEGKS